MFKRRKNRKTRSGSPRQTQRRSRAGELDYSALESREMLTTFVVNTVSNANAPNDGLISLREAVTAANTNRAFGDAPAGSVDGDRIWFSPTIANSTIMLTQELTITDDVLIQGGTNNITIAGTGNRLFNLQVNERVVFSRLTFSGGVATEGGAILSTGTLGPGSITTTIVDSMFDNNQAFIDGGGAIFHETGNLNVINTTFTDNRATGEFGTGGAIHSASGRTYVNGGSMLSNSANEGGGAVEVVNGQYISFNQQVGDDGMGNLAGDTSANPANGGALRVTGTAFVSINGGMWRNNIAARNGGAMWNGPNSQMYVRGGALIMENIASGNTNFNPGGGGGLYNSGGFLYVTGATITDNQAVSSLGRGGGVFSAAGTLRLTNSLVTGNAAMDAGGGVEVDNGFALINNSSIINNDVGVTLLNGSGWGGGMHLENSAIVVLNGGQIGNNLATNAGGGVWGHRDSQLFVRNGHSINDNRAFDDDTIGGGVYTEGFLQSIDAFFLRNDATDAGGGLYIADRGIAGIFGTNFNGNTATNRGGGIFNDASLQVNGSSFVGNVVGIEAGAVFTSPTGNSTLQNNSFVANQPNDTN
jgi:hypothetical protein